MSPVSTLVACLAFVLTSSAFCAELPEAIDAKGEQIVLETHAVGAQVYECQKNAAGALAWRFREPIATLMREGKTIGRHYAGPTWEVDSGAVVGKVVGRSPGVSANDIPWLKLTVAAKRGEGPLKEVTTVQRINTAGGMLEGACKKPGEIVAEPYAADYRFLKP